MVSQNGKLFHIDFGYILGRDPKPLPPPMKLSKEMIGKSIFYFKISLLDGAHTWAEAGLPASLPVLLFEKKDG